MSVGKRHCILRLQTLLVFLILNGTAITMWIRIILHHHFMSNADLFVVSSGSSSQVGEGPRNLKSIRPLLVAIFFMTYFYRAGEAWSPWPLDPLLVVIDWISVPLHDPGTKIEIPIESHCEAKVRNLIHPKISNCLNFRKIAKCIIEKRYFK